MAQVQFDRCWLHSTGEKEERVTSILLYNKPAGRAKKITNVRVYKVKYLEEGRWIKNLAQSEIRLKVQAEPHAEDSYLVFQCAQWRKEFPMGRGPVGRGGSIDDEQGRHFDFGPQDDQMVAICKLLTKNCKRNAFDDAMGKLGDLIGINLTMLCISCSLDACLQWNFMVSVRTYSYIGAVL
jgi:hypothetical protein